MNDRNRPENLSSFFKGKNIMEKNIKTDAPVRNIKTDALVRNIKTDAPIQGLENKRVSI